MNVSHNVVTPMIIVLCYNYETSFFNSAYFKRQKALRQVVDMRVIA